MATKEELIQNIKAWMTIDSEMKELQKSLRIVEQKRRN